jgi:hypothetical protein
MARKTPILLRRQTLGREVVVVHAYSVRDGIAHENGKHSVQADYDSLVLEELIYDGAQDAIAILAGVARGEVLTDFERIQVRRLRDRLHAIAERHNARVPTDG